MTPTRQELKTKKKSTKVKAKMDECVENSAADRAVITVAMNLEREQVHVASDISENQDGRPDRRSHHGHDGGRGKRRTRVKPQVDSCPCCQRDKVGHSSTNGDTKETPNSEKTKKVKLAETRKRKAVIKVKLRASKVSKTGKRTAGRMSKTNVGRLANGDRKKTPSQTLLKKEKGKKLNNRARKGLDDPTSGPEVAEIPEKERLRQGLEDLKSGKFKSVADSAAYWRVHFHKLYRRWKGHVAWDSTGNGPAPVLTEEEETYLANWIVTMHQGGFRVPAASLFDTVKNLFKKDNSPFIDGRPSYRWYRRFLVRNKLGKSALSKLASLCEAAPTKAVISEWFREFESFLVKLGIDNNPSQIFNYAETGFEINETKNRIVISAEKGARKSTSCNQKGAVVGVCAGADGQVLPPFIIYMYKGLKIAPPEWDLLQGAPEDSQAVFLSEEGEKQEAFSIWLENHFLKNIGQERPIVLLLGSHPNDISYKIYITLLQNDIHLFRIPRKATSFIQPLDVGEPGEGPIRSAWIMKWVAKNRKIDVGFHNIGQVIGLAWTDALNSEIIRTSSIQSGIYPLERGMVNDDHLPEGSLDFLAKYDQPENPSPKPAQKTKHPAPATISNSSETVFHQVDAKLDETTRKTYRICIENGLDLGETTLFSVWKQLYLEAFGRPVESSGVSKLKKSLTKKSGKDLSCPICHEKFEHNQKDGIRCDGQCQLLYHAKCLSQRS